MKKIIASLFILLFSTTFAFASEEVFLDVSSFNTLKAPKSPYVEMGPVDYEGNTCDPKEDYFEHIDNDEPVFESKAGQTFSKIINNTVINNKFNNYTNNITNYTK